MNRQLAPLLLLGTLFLHACGGGGSAPPPPPPPPAISVAFSTPPPGSLGLNATANIAVTVSNDSGNAGVTFTCVPAGSCGAFSAVTSTSATYTAPATVPTGGSVTITATSVSDTTKNAHSAVAINGPTIAVTFTSTIPALLQTSATLPVVVSLTNDAGNAGVTWSCAPAGTCGSFTNTTATTATYNAPGSIPTGGSVTITATSVAQTSAKATSTAILITGSASVASLKGQYAFLVLSPTGDRGTAAWVGSVTLDGTGKVTGGVEDVVSPVRNDQQDSIIASGAGSDSGYTIDASGHGRIIMQTARAEHLGISFVVTSVNGSGVATHAEVIEADGSTGDAGNPGSGTFDLQTPGDFSSSKISGAYSIILSGVDNDIAKTYPPVSLGGVFTFNTSTNPNTVSGTIDSNANGTISSNSFSTTLGTVVDSPPDVNGRGAFHIAPFAPGQPRTLVYYIVSSRVLRIFESGAVSFVGGSMYSQGTPPSSLTGNYVYQHSGWSTAGRTVAVGQFTTRANALSGISDANSGGSSTITPAKAVSVSGVFSNPALPIIQIGLDDAAGVNNFNAYPVDPSLNILDPNSPGSGGALLLHTDSNIIGTGALLPQKALAVFSLNYALNLVNAIAASTPHELDLVGILTSDGASSFTANLADYARDSPTPIPVLGAGLAGAFTADAGRYTGSLTVTSLDTTYSFLTGSPTAGATPATFSVAIYQASPSQAFVVETDNQAIAVGQMIKQNLP